MRVSDQVLKHSRVRVGQEQLGRNLHRIKESLYRIPSCGPCRTGSGGMVFVFVCVSPPLERQPQPLEPLHLVVRRGVRTEPP